jgi:ABC-type dipeptide/oligopeptide/nickel transport system ATPase component
VLIAMSLLHDPRLLLADEPTSALDIVTQQEVLGLLRRLAASRRMATLFISHDLLSVAALCDRVAILHEGEIVEEAVTAVIFRSPAHPYTQRLIGALPRLPEAALRLPIRRSWRWLRRPARQEARGCSGMRRRPKRQNKLSTKTPQAPAPGFSSRSGRSGADHPRLRPGTPATPTASAVPEIRARPTNPEKPDRRPHRSY